MKIQIQIGDSADLLIMHVQAIPRVGDLLALQNEEWGGESLNVIKVVIFATETEEKDIAAHVQI